MKTQRHARIIDLISRYEIETQEELASLLQERGFSVTQATVSRDIRQLQLMKIARGEGRAVYTAGASYANDGDRFRQILKTAFVSADVSANMLVIHTVSGMAMAACAALDACDWPEMLGTIAGDDTIFAVIRSEEEAGLIVERIKGLIR